MPRIQLLDVSNGTWRDHLDASNLRIITDSGVTFQLSIEKASLELRSTEGLISIEPLAANDVRLTVRP